MVSKYFSTKGGRTRTPQSFAQLDSETLRGSMKHEKILRDTELGTRPSECLHTPQGRKGLRVSEKINERVPAAPHAPG